MPNLGCCATEEIKYYADLVFSNHCCLTALDLIPRNDYFMRADSFRK
jgi:hypothetical protein